MLEREPKPTHALGTPGGTGTADMRRRIERACADGVDIKLTMLEADRMKQSDRVVGRFMRDRRILWPLARIPMAVLSRETRFHHRHSEGAFMSAHFRCTTDGRPSTR